MKKCGSLHDHYYKVVTSGPGIDIYYYAIIMINGTYHFKGKKTSLPLKFLMMNMLNAHFCGIQLQNIA